MCVSPRCVKMFQVCTLIIVYYHVNVAVVVVGIISYLLRIQNHWSKCDNGARGKPQSFM